MNKLKKIREEHHELELKRRKNIKEFSDFCESLDYDLSKDQMDELLLNLI